MGLINLTLNVMAHKKGQTSAILCGRARLVCRLHMPTTSQHIYSSGVRWKNSERPADFYMRLVDSIDKY